MYILGDGDGDGIGARRGGGLEVNATGLGRKGTHLAAGVSVAEAKCVVGSLLTRRRRLGGD